MQIRGGIDMKILQYYWILGNDGTLSAQYDSARRCGRRDGRMDGRSARCGVCDVPCAGPAALPAAPWTMLHNTAGINT